MKRKRHEVQSIPPCNKHKTELQETVRKIKEFYKSSPKCVQWMAKIDKIRLNQSKQELQEAIDMHNKRIRYVERIQANIRRHFVQSFIKSAGWKGCCIHNCINNTDFYTLEELTNVPTEFIFYHKTNDKYCGFDILSLVTMLDKQATTVNAECMNPYTREKMNPNHILQMFHLLPILFPDVVALHKERFIALRKPELQLRRQPPVTIFPRGDYRYFTADMMTAHYGYFESSSPWYNRIDYLNAIMEMTNLRQSELLLRLAFLETLPMERRIIELFIDIDLMGNYTSAEWFTELTRHELSCMYVYMMDTWNHMEEELKRKICILGSPFDVFQLHNLGMIPLREWRQICVTIMELFTYGGETMADRKTGVFYILYGLAFINERARAALRHLL